MIRVSGLNLMPSVMAKSCNSEKSAINFKEKMIEEGPWIRVGVIY